MRIGDTNTTVGFDTSLTIAGRNYAKGRLQITHRGIDASPCQVLRDVPMADGRIAFIISKSDIHNAVDFIILEAALGETLLHRAAGVWHFLLLGNECEIFGMARVGQSVVFGVPRPFGLSHEISIK